MKKTKLLRAMALFLAFVFVAAGSLMPISAADSDPSSSISGTTTEDIKALLNAISYNDYIADHIKAGVNEKGGNLVLDATKNWTYKEDATIHSTDVPKLATYDGKEGLYIPSLGTVTWTTTEIKEPTAYNLVIKYYPVVDKAAPIDRVLLINDEIPFAEARQMSIEKIWKTAEPCADYPIYSGKVTHKIGWKEVEKTTAEWIKEAEKVGIKAYEHPKKLDGVTYNYLRYDMPTTWDEAKTEYVKSLDMRFFASDIDENEIRSNLVDAPEWTTYYFKDANGYMQDPFKIVLEPNKDGEVKISLKSENQPICISEIHLVEPSEKNRVYSEYAAIHKNVGEGKGNLKIEAEYFSNVSSQTIYPVSDNTSAITSPAATDKTLLNTVGGDKWQSAGQWIEYKFTVSDTGMYQIVPRFKQNLLDGMYVARALYIYSEGVVDENGNRKKETYKYDGIPFEEAGRITFDFSNDWQTKALGYGDTTFNFFFEEDVVYTIRFEVTLGDMGDIVRRVQESLDNINNDYLNILKLTGPTPDEYRDYNFKRVMPDTIGDLLDQSAILAGDEASVTCHECEFNGKLKDFNKKRGVYRCPKCGAEVNEGGIAGELKKAAGEKSSSTATLERVAFTLAQMGDDDKVAKNLEQLKTHIGTLGTWLSNAKTQPLILDYICIQGASAKMPKAKANIIQTLWHEVSGFVQSFFRNYDRMGAMTQTNEGESVEVWLAYGRDQAQVIRGLINNDFTYNGGAPVNLKLVSGGTLLPSILSGSGPDVYIGLGQADVINYAIRGALVSIDDLPEQYVAEYGEDGVEEFIKDFKKTPEEFRKQYDDTLGDFNEAAMMVLEVENSKGETHCYGLPETQNFNMMFVREDILAELDIAIPKTWDDVKEAIPVLQANNMQIGMHNDVKIFLYQNNGELFADNGMRINLDSNVALDSFTTMCDFFTMYSFPYKYDFANRFRTGEMPIGFAVYTGTYNHLKVFATEIEGLWSFYPMPGVMDATGKINSASVSTVSPIVMIKGCDNRHDAWEFMRWHADDQCQIAYSNEMVAILGPSAKHATANEAAMMVLEVENAKGETHCYGLPETQNFNMIFVREDILAELDIAIPKTWDDVKEAIPVLQANNMQIGMHNDVKIFLYQNGGELFADNGMRINLDSNVALDSFTTMCDFFTMYSFPYKYDFANRFRTGEMPIGFAVYTGTYNHLKVFATEIEGLWSFYPMPGVMDENGNINNASVSTVTAIVMIKDCKDKSDSWDFMRWHADDTCQIAYSNEMVAILGPSAKHATANETALTSMPWTEAERAELLTQFQNLASVPNYPGSYIVDRYLKFAFLDAYDDNRDPGDAIEDYVLIINKEISRKRDEFGLEVLTDPYDEDKVCPTLANKRLRQTEIELNKYKNGLDPSYKQTYENIMKLISGYETEDYASLEELASNLETLAAARKDTRFKTAIKYMRDAAYWLKDYERYK